MKYLGQGIKYLPNNIQNLQLHLDENRLGENTENYEISRRIF